MPIQITTEPLSPQLSVSFSGGICWLSAETDWLVALGANLGIVTVLSVSQRAWTTSSVLHQWPVVSVLVGATLAASVAGLHEPSSLSHLNDSMILWFCKKYHSRFAESES